MKILKCTNCNSEIPANSKFCLNCGTKTSVTCEFCNSILPSGSKFCSECGHHVITSCPPIASSQSDTLETNTNFKPVSEPTYDSYSDVSSDITSEPLSFAQPETIVNPTPTSSNFQPSSESTYFDNEFKKIANNQKPSFNWCALFFGPIYTLYKKSPRIFAKMYLGPIFLSLTFMITQPIIYAYFDVLTALISLLVMQVIIGLYSFGTAIRCGMTFNKLYYNQQFFKNSKPNFNGSSNTPVRVAGILTLLTATIILVLISSDTGIFDSLFAREAEGNFFSNYSTPTENTSSMPDSSSNATLDDYLGEWYIVDGNTDIYMSLSNSGSGSYFIDAGYVRTNGSMIYAIGTLTYNSSTGSFDGTHDMYDSGSISIKIIGDQLSLTSQVPDNLHDGHELILSNAMFSRTNKFASSLSSTLVNTRDYAIYLPNNEIVILQFFDNEYLIWSYGFQESGFLLTGDGSYSIYGNDIVLDVPVIYSIEFDYDTYEDYLVATFASIDHAMYQATLNNDGSISLSHHSYNDYICLGENKNLTMLPR